MQVTSPKHEATLLIKSISSCCAGALASLLTQPFEVIKTNRINQPSELYRNLHRMIISNGWRQYMKGGSIAVTRQAFGFSSYIALLQLIQSSFFQLYPSFNKYLTYSISSVTAKMFAMIIEAPLTLLKTRMEVVKSGTLSVQIKRVFTEPLRNIMKGLGSSLARQAFYTLFHYNTYRYIKDDFMMKRGYDSTFIPAVIAGVVAITVSQPFEVIRSQVSIKKINGSFIDFMIGFTKSHGWRGYFLGFIPRLIRKPINSGICWSVSQKLKKQLVL